MVAVGFKVRAGLARGCVRGLCCGLQGRCVPQGSQQASFLSDNVPVGAHYVSFLPAFMGFPPWKTGGNEHAQVSI